MVSKLQLLPRSYIRGEMACQDLMEWLSECSQTPKYNTDKIFVLEELRPHHTHWKESAFFTWNYLVPFWGFWEGLSRLASVRCCF